MDPIRTQTGSLQWIFVVVGTVISPCKEFVSNASVIKENSNGCLRLPCFMGGGVRFGGIESKYIITFRTLVIV